MDEVSLPSRRHCARGTLHLQPIDMRTGKFTHGPDGPDDEGYEFEYVVRCTDDGATEFAILDEEGHVLVTAKGDAATYVTNALTAIGSVFSQVWNEWRKARVAAELPTAEEIGNAAMAFMRDAVAKGRAK